MVLEDREISVEPGEEIKLLDSLKSNKSEEIMKWMDDFVPQDVEDFLTVINNIKINIFKTDAILSTDTILNTSIIVDKVVINIKSTF